MDQAEQEHEEASGLLRLTVGGARVDVPELKWRANRAWQASLRETLDRLAKRNLAVDTPEGLEAMADAERELVLAYDATGALGGLEDATEREISAIYDRLIEVSYPQAQSRATVMMMLARQAIASAQASSTSSPSPSGTSGPTTSTPPSPSARSRSSSARRRSA